MIALLVALVSLTSGCGGAGTGSRTTQPPSDSRSIPDPPAVEDQAVPDQETTDLLRLSAPTTDSGCDQRLSRTELLDGGLEPRQVLRMSTQVGAQQALRSSWKRSISVTGPAQTRSITSAGDVDVDYVVEGVEADRWTVRGTYGEAELTTDDPHDRERTTGYEDLLDHVVVVTDRSDRGCVDVRAMSAPNWSGDDDIAAELGTSIRSSAASSLILPAEPVGVGARWTLRGTVAAPGLQLEGTITCSLVGVDDVTVTVAIEVEAESDAMDVVVRDGSTVSASVSFYSFASVVWDLTEATGTTAELVDLKLNFPTGIPEAPVPLTQHVQQTSEVRSR